jgi:hypothetical protein
MKGESAMANQNQEKRYRRVYRPKIGVDYSAVLNGVRQIVRVEAKHAKDDWTVRVVETGQFWHINPKSLETSEPE